MADRLTGTLRMFGVVDRRWTSTNVDAAESSYTEADPRPGSAQTEAVDVRSAPQIVGAQTVPVIFEGSQAAGHPGLGEDGGAFKWQLSSDAAGEHRSWEPPIRVTGCHLFSGPLQNNQPAVVAFPLSGRVLIGWDSTAAWYLYDPYTDAWDIVSNPDNTNSDVWALAVIPGTDRVLAIDLRAGVTWRSDDYGTTWVQHASYSSLWDHSVGSGYYRRVSAAFDGTGSLVIAAQRSGSSGLDLWASADLGCTWRLTGPFTIQGGVVSPSPDGSVYLVWRGLLGTGLYVTRMGSAFDNPGLIDEVELDSAAYDDEVVAVDDDGVPWVYGRPSAGSDNRWDAWYSLDSGSTFEGPITNVIRAGSDTLGDYFWRPSAVFAGGRCFFVSGEDDSLSSGFYAGLMTLGGWCSRSYDRQLTGVAPIASDPARKLLYRLAFNSTTNTTVWHCHSTPASYSGSGWTETLTGTGAIAQAYGGTWPSAGGTDFRTAGVGDEAYAAQTVTNGTDDHYVEWSAGRGDSVALASSPQGGIRLRGPAYDYTIRVAQDGFQVYDHEAAGTVGAVVALGGTQHRVDFRVRHDGAGELTINYREIEPGTDAYHTRWFTVTRTLTSGGARSDLAIRFGMVAPATVATAQSYRMFFVHVAAYGTAGTYTLPERVDWGKAVGSDYAYPLPDVSDPTAARLSRFRVRGGPVLQGEVITVGVAPGYPVAALFPTEEPSPSRRWRSTATGVTQDFSVDVGDGYPTLPAGSWSVALVAQAANFRRIELAGKIAGAYTTIGTLDLATGFTGLSFSRFGRGVRPATTGTDGARFVRAGELVGGHVVLDPGGGSEVRRRIAWNSSGFWGATGSSTTVRPLLTLEGVDGSEPTSGTIDIVWPAGVLVVHSTVANASMYRYYRARIPSTEGSPDAYYEAGDVSLHGLVVPGKQWGHGWEWELSPNIRIDEDLHGTQRRAQRGPNRRSVSLSWDHGARDDRVRGVTEAKYAGAASAAPLAAQDDVWGQLWALADLTDGGSLPALLITQDPGSGNTLTDPTLWMAGYLEANVRLQEAAGRSGEGVDSFYRAGPIRFVERV